VVVPGTTFLGGSGVFTDTCLRVLLGLGEVGLSDAIDMAGARPRELLGLPALALKEGMPADLILFEHGSEQVFELKEMLIGGMTTALP
jgi:N-acetylglucosamine-6-phosphate deacetylase